MSVPSISHSDKGICIICAKAPTLLQTRIPDFPAALAFDLGHRNRDRQPGRSVVECGHVGMRLYEIRLRKGRPTSAIGYTSLEPRCKQDQKSTSLLLQCMFPVRSYGSWD